MNNGGYWWLLPSNRFRISAGLRRHRTALWMKVKKELRRMSERLFIAVIGSRNSGKSTTWNELFGRTVHTGKEPRLLKVGDEQHVEVFLISGSNEERRQYAADILENVDCRIILCSVQYAEAAFQSTWEYIFTERFAVYAQWLNPGFGGSESWDRLGLVPILLAHGSIVSVRDGRNGSQRLSYRVEEIREYVHGWAAARKLLRGVEKL
jgi:hypothetical protein